MAGLLRADLEGLFVGLLMKAVGRQGLIAANTGCSSVHGSTILGSCLGHVADDAGVSPATYAEYPESFYDDMPSLE